MIHNIVTDKNGDEHQAVKAPHHSDSDNCLRCSVISLCLDGKSFPCLSLERLDNTEVIYKRRIKIGDVKR